MARVPPEPTKCFFTVKVRYVTMGVQNLSISLLDSSISPLQDTIRPSGHPLYSSLGSIFVSGQPSSISI